MNNLYKVNLMPIEPLLFTDNRSARAGEDHLIRDQDPSPHTIYGAIGACIAGMYGVEIDEKEWKKVANILGDFQRDIKVGSENRSELLGYYYSDTNNNAWFPCPQHIRLRQRYSQVFVGNGPKVTELSTNVTSSSLNELKKYLDYETDVDERDRSDLISEEMLRRFLCDEMVGEELKIGIDRIPIDMLFKNEVRLGLGMNYTKNQTITGRLFSRPYRRYRSQVTNMGDWQSVSLIAFFRTIAPLDEKIIKRRRIAVLGGDRGRALTYFQPSASSDMLSEVRKAVMAATNGSNGFFIYLLTPAVWENQWPLIKDEKPIAAAIGKSRAISGWSSNSQAQHPRPIRRLLPAGTVFFFNWPGNKPDSQLIDEYWLEPITRHSGNNYRNSGFGRMLIGVWRHEK